MTAETPLLDELRAGRPAAKAKRPLDVESILRRMVEGGRHRLQFVVDFDMTLTKSHRDGLPVDCSWGVMENSPLLPSDYTSRSGALKQKYLPIEHNPDMSVEEKLPHIVEWYEKTNELLQICGLKKNMIPKMVEGSSVQLRDDTDLLLRRLQDDKIPVLVLSAGCGDLVEAILERFRLMSENVKVVSNFLAYDTEGNVTGIAGDMVHLFNKNENAVHDSPYFKRLEGRSNVVLMGDSLGDLQMAQGVPDQEALLKIGFLNDRTGHPTRLEKYMDAFDIVLIDDQTMDVANWLLTKIATSNEVAA